MDEMWMLSRTPGGAPGCVFESREDAIRMASALMCHNGGPGPEAYVAPVPVVLACVDGPDGDPLDALDELLGSMGAGDE